MGNSSKARKKLNYEHDVTAALDCCCDIMSGWDVAILTDLPSRRWYTRYTVLLMMPDMHRLTKSEVRFPGIVTGKLGVGVELLLLCRLPKQPQLGTCRLLVHAGNNYELL